jgi:hypothetical protein
MGGTFDLALSYLKAGLAVTPIHADGSKRPVLTEWEKRPLPTAEQLHKWFGGRPRYGIGIVCGKVSGNLELIDFDKNADTVFAAWCEVVEAQAPGLVARLNVIRTPRQPAGYHVRYRCPEVEIPGNHKLAEETSIDPKTGKPNRLTLIETRGEGGQGLVPGCLPECHSTGGLYQHHSGPALTEVQAISAADRAILLAAARSFDRCPEEPAGKGRPTGRSAKLPGSDFNLRGPSILELVTAHGWVKVHQKPNVLYVRRPGKEERCWSGTIGYCTAKDGTEMLAVFSTNAHPFEGATGSRKCSCYDRFAVYTFLNHDGDFKAAAKALAAQGYGEPRRRDQAARPPGQDRAADSRDGNGHGFELGDLVLIPGKARLSKANRLSLPLAVFRHGEQMDFLQLSNTASGRKYVAQQLRQHLGEDAAALENVDGTIAAVITAAVRSLQPEESSSRSQALAIVRAKVPQILQLRYRADQGRVWSETRGEFMNRADFLAFTPPWLLEEIARTCPVAGADPLAFLPDADAALRAAWPELLESLPRAPEADLGPDSAAAVKFRECLKKLWKVTKTWEQAANPNDPVSRSSLIGRANTQFQKKKDGGRRGRWEPVLPSVDAWWRRHVREDGEEVCLLAMRWELTYQVGVDLPGVYDEASLTTLGQKFHVLDPEPPVSCVPSGKKRLAVLARDLTEELLDDPAAWPHSDDT